MPERRLESLACRLKPDRAGSKFPILTKVSDAAILTGSLCTIQVVSNILNSGEVCVDWKPIACLMFKL